MAALSIVAGPPLSEEEGLGTLTLGGWLREVTQAHAGREALVFHGPDGVVRWSHDDLWAQANAVARSLVACGVGKGTRVGVLMTNRPEFLSAVFGVALAGGVAATLSTFSTPAELDHLVQSSACSVLLLERNVLKKDFGAILADLEPAIGVAGDGRLVSTRFPFLRHLAAVDGAMGRIEGWSDFLARGDAVDQAPVSYTHLTLPTTPYV